MPANTQTAGLDIVISAIDKASKTLKDIQKDVDNLAETVDKSNEEAEDGSKRFGDMFKAFMAGKLVTTAVTASIRFAGDAVRMLNDVMQESVGVASNYELTMKGLDSVATAFGHSSNKVREAAIALSEDGLLAPAVAAEALKNLLSGLKHATLEQNVALIEGMKNTAAYNRTLDNFSDAVVQTTRGIRNRNSMTSDSAGVQTNLNIIMKQSGFDIQDLDSKSKGYAATQAFVNGYLEESAFAAGNAAEFLETYQGQIVKTNGALLETKRLLGEAIIPVFEAFTEVQADTVASLKIWLEENQGKIRGIAIQIGNEIKEIISDVINFFNDNQIVFNALLNFSAKSVKRNVAESQIVANSLMALGNSFANMANTAVVSYKTVEAAVTFNWGKIKDIWSEYDRKSDEISQSVSKNFQAIGDAWGDAWDSDVNVQDWWNDLGGDAMDRLQADITHGMNNIKDESDDTGDEITKNLQKENVKYAREVAKRQANFERSFDDLVRAHRDMITQLTADIAEEAEQYAETMITLAEDFDDSMTDIKSEHKKKTNSIIDDMEAERKKAADVIKEINEGYTDQRNLITAEGADRLSDLKAQLAQEKVLGANGNQDTITLLETMIAREQEGLDSSLEAIQDKNDEDVADIEETLNDKLTIWETELADENGAYNTAILERKIMYEDDLAAATTAFEEKTATIQTELDKELVIRQAYSDEFTAIGDTESENDIARLIRTNTEAATEQARAHAERIADINAETVDLSKALGNVTEDIKTKTDEMGNAFEGIRTKVKNLKNWILGLFNLDITRSVPPAFIQQKFKSGWELGVPGGGGGGGVGVWGNGGITSMPGIVAEDHNPEAILPLSKPKRMQTILDSLGLNSNSGAVQQTFYVNVEKPFDVDLIMERAGFAYNQGGF